jgi:hypothetical protein
MPGTVRRLRLALIALSMVCAVLVLIVAGVLGYWQRYLLGPGEGAFARGPFLVDLSESSAALAWRVRDDADVDLRAVDPSGHEHVGREGSFRGLRPGTTYAWTAAVKGKTEASGTFTTAPTTLAEPIQFGVIGDYGSGNDHEWAVGRVLAAGRPAFVLTTGDNSYLAALPQLLDRNIFKPLAEVMANARLWATMGEHDTFWRGGAAVTAALHLPGEGGRYALRYGPLQVVLLGLTAADAGAQAFARRELSRPGPKVRFVVVHRPILRGNPLLPFLRRRGVAAVFAGHLHRYERKLLEGVLQLTVGTGGEGSRNERFTLPTPDAITSLLDYGALRVRVTAGGVEYRFVDERGRVLDRLGSPLNGP